VGSLRGLLVKSFLVLTAILILLYVSSNVWLAAIGRALVYNDGPAKAEAAVVLAGDLSGGRVIEGAELARGGYVPIVLVSGPPGFYGVNEADAAIHYVVDRGYPAEWFVPVRHTGMSTRDEAENLLNEVQRRRIRSFLLVTSNFHTRRARRIFLASIKRRGGSPVMRVVSTPDHEYNPDSWWKTRQGWKMAFFEWTKTVTSMVGI
jgi:uncharacterized SAM-binding protein YcdF (DUF218 family)